VDRVNAPAGGAQPVSLTAYATRQYADILGIRTAYYRSCARPRPGQPAIVLVHGGAPGASAELNWFRNFAVLAAAGYDVIAYDQPGFGYSSQPADHGIDFRYQHLVATLQALAPDAVHLAGNSIGGLLCSLYALRRPAAAPRARSLILAAPFPYFDPPAAANDRLLAHRGRLGSIEPTFESIQALCMNTFNQPAQVTDDIVRLRLDMLAGERWNAYKARAGASREFERADVLGRQLDTPTLLVWGVQDRSLPCEIGIEAMQHLSRGQFVFLTQCGHWPQTEHADAFNRLALAFLDEHGRP